jgi:hypothetical protein
MDSAIVNLKRAKSPHSKLLPWVGHTMFFRQTPLGGGIYA